MRICGFLKSHNSGLCLSNSQPASQPDYALKTLLIAQHSTHTKRPKLNQRIQDEGLIVVIIISNLWQKKLAHKENFWPNV